MNPDDIQHNSPAMSDSVRPSPTQSDHDGQRPTMSATRSDHHTMTTTEVVKLFEESGLPREKRSIERYCEAGKLDCFKDPDEMRYYITQESAEKLIGHLKELQARHQQPNASAPTAASGATVENDVRQRPTLSHNADAVKRGTPDTQSEKHRTGEDEEQLTVMTARIKELENENFLLKVGKQAAEQVVTKLGDYIKEDREHYTKLIQQTNKDVAKYSRRLGQLETHIKHRQLSVPDRDTTDDDNDDLDDAATIEAEFSEGPASA
jgi:uncharacterized protein (DUF1778 family)